MSRRSRGARLAFVMLIVAGACPSMATAAATERNSVAATCPIVLVGLRGSGQSFSDGRGFGSPLSAIADELEKQLRKGRDVVERPVPYPAAHTPSLSGTAEELGDQINAFFDSVEYGYFIARAVVEKALAECPTSDVVILGYSQGAWVARDLIDSWRAVGFADWDRVHVGLVADPRRVAPSTFNFGTAPADLQGLAQFIDGIGEPLPDELKGHAFSWCLDSDVVCAYRKSDVGGAGVHSRYLESEVPKSLSSQLIRSISQRSSVRDASGHSSTNLLLLLDSSGSMGEQDSAGRIRIEGAKTGLLQFLRRQPVDTNVGVRTYPGGVADAVDGCRSGTRVLDIEPHTFGEMSFAVRSLKPEGDTPTSAALRAASADIAQRGGGTIVLVSDGEHTCGEPPCDVARAIRESGQQLTVYTVGFSISPKGAEELRCVAEATGGEYRNAEDVGDLQIALDDLSTPALRVEVDAPKSVSSVTGSGGDGSTIVARVTASSARTVPAATVNLVFEGESPGVLRPFVQLGNLQPGESRRVTWEFTPFLDFTAREMKWSVIAAGAGAARVQQSGTIAVTTGFSASDFAPALDASSRIAILGDSYAAGEGAGAYLPGTDTSDNGCHQSNRTLGAVFRRRSILACSGAITSDIVHENTRQHRDGKPLPSQLDDLSRAAESGEFDAALLMIGGNNIRFADLAVSCAAGLSTCADVREISIYRDLLAGLLVDLLDTYRAVDDALNAHRPTGEKVATTYVLGYPQLFPHEGELATRRCSSVISKTERIYANAIVAELNDVIRTAVGVIRKEGRPIEFVSEAEDAFLPDHTYCAEAPWVNRLDLAKNLSNPWARRKAEQLHPTEAGYTALTASLARHVATATTIKRTASRQQEPATSAGGDRIQLSDASVPELTSGVGATLRLEGMDPQTEVRAFIRSDPRLLGAATVAADGTATIALALPSDLEAGRHTIVVDSIGQGNRTLAEHRVDVVDPPDAAWWWLVLVIGGVVVAGATVTRRR